MTSWLRLTLGLVRPLLVVAAVLLPCATVTAYTASAASSASPAASDSPVVRPSRAGGLAGEGRLHPGRPQGPEAKVQGQDADEDTPDGVDPAVPEPPQDVALNPSAPAHTTAQDDTGSGSRILSLGGGLVLIGLGLAFLGLRVRRG